MKLDPVRALKAGFLATVVMTAVMYGLPIIGIPPMDIMAALGSVFPFKISPYVPGAIVHFSMGVVLALIYGLLFHGWLPGPNWLRGALFSLLPWLFAITLLGPSLELATRVFGTPTPSAAGPATPSPANPRAPKSVNPCAPTNPCAPKAAPNPCAAQAPQPCAQKAAQPCLPAAQPCAPKPAQPCAPAAQPGAPGGAAPAGIPPQVLSLVVHLIYGGVVGAFYRPRGQ